MTIWYILCSFGTFFSGFGIIYQEKSGNPAWGKKKFESKFSNFFGMYKTVST
jgi:hypothetical protein